MQITQKFYDFIVLLNSKYCYINASETIDDEEDWRIFFKKDLLKYMRNIRDYNLKELCIFFVDDFLSKKTDWSMFLIEKTILTSNSGGSLFYERLNLYIENQDIEMTKCYLVALKFGFTGYKQNPLKDEYEEFLIKFKGYGNLKNEIMLQQYEGDMIRSYKFLGFLFTIIIMACIPIIIKIYYVIVTFNHLNNCYLQWGY